MEFMFDECYKLKEIKGINTFNTSKVQNMRAMFKECKEIEYLDLSNFNTSNVSNMEYMFCYCDKLKTLTKKLEKSIKVNKDKLHKILYDKEEMINIDDLDELNKNLSFYFYLNFLI